MIFKKIIASILIFSMCFSSLGFINISAQENTYASNEAVANEVKKETGVDVFDVNLENFEEEFNFLVNDPVFIELEEYLVLSGQDVTFSDSSVQGQWIPIVAQALRLLTSKVGKEGMQKGWALARPYVKKALDAPSLYELDGPGSGGRIIQVRNKKGGSVVFRLDYFPIKHGGDYYLHYHVPPNLKEHHIIF